MPRRCLCLLLLLIVAVQPLAGQTGVSDESVYPAKQPSRRPWEQLVSLPGTVLYAPFWITFKGVEQLVAFSREYHPIDQVYRFFVTDDGRRGLFPRFDPKHGSGFHFFQKGMWGPRSQLSVGLSGGFRGRRHMQLKFRELPLFGPRVKTDFSVRYRFQTTETFFGLGPDSERVDKSSYGHRYAEAELALALSLGGRHRLGLRLGVERNQIEAGRSDRVPSITEFSEYSETTLPGLEEDALLMQVTLEWQHDGTNRLFRPSAGRRMLLRGGAYVQPAGDDFGFWQVTGDIKQYRHLVFERIIVIRFGWKITTELGDRHTPFYYLSELGSQETIRGFARGRFRSDDMILGSLEYRYPIWDVIDAFWFVDAGRVTPNLFDSLKPEDLQYGYGGGLRHWNSTRVVSNLVVSKSREQWRIYFGLNRTL